MNLLAQSAFLNALGWALLHSLWQMGILWLLYITITANSTKFQARQRYNLALLFAITGTVVFLITLTNQYYLLAEPSIVLAQQYSSGLFASANNAPLLSTTALLLEPVMPFFSVAYLFAIGLLFVRLYRQYFFSRALTSSGLQKAHPDLRLFLQQMTQRFTIKKQIRISLSELVTTPLTVGFWKPVILLPVAVINQLSIQQTEAIILHELNHIKQNDYLINLFIACLDIILFFNPFSRLLTGILMKERENSCDDMVLQFRYAPAEYAKALLILEQNRLQPIPLIAVSATGNTKKILLERVQRILYGKSNTSPVNNRMIAFLLSVLLIGCIGFFNPEKTIIQQLPDLPVTYSPPVSSEVVPIIVTPVSNSSPKEPAVKNINTARLLSPQQEYIVWLNKQKKAVADQEAGLALLIEAANQNKNYMPESSVISGFASIEDKQEFSIQENTIIPSTESFVEEQPYVPSYSFSYQYTEDTSLPKRYVPTITELKAKENLELALRALEEINWQNLKKELAKNKKIDIAQLQASLKKALAEIDWKKMEGENTTGTNQAAEELKIKQAYLQNLQKLQKNYLSQKQLDDQKRQLLLMDRIMQNKELQQCEENKRKDASGKVKKVVVI